MTTKLLLAACVLSLCGCKSLSKAVVGLKDDKAALKVSLKSIQGNLDLWRMNPGPGHSVTISPDGVMRMDWVGTNTAPPLAQPQPVSVIRTPEVDRAIDAFFGTRPPPKANSAP